jgi:capsid protein
MSVAASLGVTYEALTGDYGNVNFSSGRMGWIEFNRNIELWRWQMFIPQFCMTTWKWFVEAATVVGVAPRGEYVTAEWTAPRREMIDPTKEFPAMRDAVRSGLLTMSEAVRSMGYDPQNHFEEMQKDNERLDQLGLVIDSDPRKTSRGGQLQVEQKDEGQTSEPPAADDEEDQGSRIYQDDSGDLWREDADGFVKVEA